MKPNYMSPVVKVVEFKVERGFEGSNVSLSFEKNNNEFLMDFYENYGPRNEQFSRTDHDETFFN